MTKGRRKNTNNHLGKREQQMLDLLYQFGPSTANELQKKIGDNLINTTVRSILKKLEEKGYVTHEKKSREFVYQPLKDKETVAKNKFKKIINTFFGGSLSDAVATLIDPDSEKLTKEQAEEFRAMIAAAKKHKQE